MTDSNASLIRSTAVSAYTVPTTSPESYGTLEWDSTTLVLSEVTAGDTTGTGFTYADRAAATLIEHTLAHQIHNESPLDIPSLWTKLQTAIRGSGRAGISAMAISAIDIALWDLKAKLLGTHVISFWAPPAIASIFTAAADSPPTQTPNSANSSALGQQTASPP